MTIKDTGIGIKEENLEKLFTGFTQVDASRKRREGGLGLGLAISHALVQKMGGTTQMRDEYSNMLLNMSEKLKLKCKICRNYPELKRRMEKEVFSHIFTGIAEYQEKPEFFDELAKQTKVIVVLESKSVEEMLSAYKIKVTKAVSGKEAVLIIIMCRW